MSAQSWFTDARFGLFVHWGLYSLGARHEWLMKNERIPVARYERYARYFDPDLYDPAAWARAAKDAGMKYVVLTTKHHDGFCMWDSALTDYTAVHTPAGRDLVREFVDAVRAEGLRVGFYHSLLDWHHPDFPIDALHPRADAPAEDIARANAGRDIARYRSYLHGQVRELLTGYGQVDYLFFDFSYAGRADWWGGKGPDDWGSAELLAMVRELQPGIIVNDRLGIPGDLVTPEQYQPSAPMTVDGVEVAWEACQTIDGSWGYFRDKFDRKSPELMLRMLIDGVSKNGNLLLNVGPTARGEFPDSASAPLAVIGEWMRRHARAIHAAGPAPFTPPPDARYTMRGDRLYLHLFAWPFENVHLPGLAGRVAYAQFLHDASEVSFADIPADAVAFNMEQGAQPPGTLTLTLPVVRPDVTVPVIELILV